MLKVVLDTNVLVDALNGSGLTWKILNLGLRSKFRLIVSYDILYELMRVLREYFGWSDERRYRWYQRIGDCALVVRPLIKVEGCRDLDDNKLLECCLSEKADYLVSKDNDLLDIGEFHGVKIVNVDDFWQILVGKGLDENETSVL